MEQILGEKFSTAYFDAEYEKLALLERSQLNPKTVPAPLLELEKYAEHDSNGNVTIQSKVLKEKLDQLTPVIKVGKIAGKRQLPFLISISNLMYCLKLIPAWFLPMTDFICCRR